MPSKIRRARITAKIDDCIIELFGTEWRKKAGLRPSTVVERFREKYPESFTDCADAFAENYLLNVASGRLRNGSAALRAAKSKVLVLPGLADTILENLPPLITIPCKGRGEIHKPMTHALVWEFRAYRNLLKRQLDNDGLRFGAVDFIYKAIETQPDNIRVTKAWSEALAKC